MWKIYVGNLSSRIKERELADEFNSYGLVRSVWVARKPPGYAFLEFESRREANDAISALDGKHGWRVEMSRKSIGGLQSRSSSSERRCRECGSGRHCTSDCRSGAAKRSDRQSPSPRGRTTTNRHSSPERHRRSRSPRQGNGSLPRKRERSISPEEGLIILSENDQDSHADECDGPKQPESNASPEQYSSRSQDNREPDGSSDECNVLRKHERKGSSNDYSRSSPQDDQGSYHATNHDAPRQHERSTSVAHYHDTHDSDQDSSEDECNVPRKRERHRSPDHYPSISPQNNQDTHMDEKQGKSGSPERELSKSLEHGSKRSPQNDLDDSLADESSPAREEPSGSISPLFESSPEY